MATVPDALSARPLLALVGLLLLIVPIAAACSGGDDASSTAGELSNRVTAQDVEDQAAAVQAAAAQAPAAEDTAADDTAEQVPAVAEQPQSGEQIVDPGYPAGTPSAGPADADGDEAAESGKTGPSAEAVVDPSDADSDRPPAPASPASGIAGTEDILVPRDHAARDEFGWSADTDGVRIISGAPFHDDQGAESGVAYIFIRDAAGAWVQEAKLLPDDGEAGSWFGRWAAIDGDVAVVGAPLADAVGDDDDAGAAYVFQRIDGAWVQTQRLVADTPKGGQQFGWNVEIDGDTVVISASNDSDGGGQRLYVFQRRGDQWVGEAVLTPNDPGADFFFAQDIGIAGDTIVAGAKGRDTFAGANSGAAYVFQRTDAGWVQTARLEPDDAFVFDLFGRSVSIAGDTIVVGAYLEDEAGPDAGSVYVFERDPAAANGWRQDAKLIGASTGEMDWFGYELDTDGQTIVVGAPHTDRLQPEVFHAGLATVFSRTADGWVQTAEFAASDVASTGDSSDYGWAVTVQADVVMIGAWLADTAAGPDAGRAYAYTLPAAP